MTAQQERVMALWLPELSSPSAHNEQRWHQTLEAIESLMPGVSVPAPGLVLLRARGPARYYGGEAEAAQVLIEAVAELGIAPVRIGVANGRFAAEQAAYTPGANGSADDSAPTRVCIVPAEQTAQFLAPLPIGNGVDAELAEVLLGLGIRTLGAFAELPETAVHERFGASGLAAHRRARGSEDARTPLPTATPRGELSAVIPFEPPIDDTDHLAFACRASVETFAEALLQAGLVCTELRIELTDDTGNRSERQWTHPAHFTPADMINRIRWQAEATPRDPDRGGAGISEVRLAPIRTARAADHEPGLWSTAPDQRVHHQLSRVQSLLGYEGVGIGEVIGGRLSAERQRFMPWGATTSDDLARRYADAPWPGKITGTTPSRVLPHVPRVELLDCDQHDIDIDDDDLLTASPAWLRSSAAQIALSPVQAWSAPWPLREGWWRTANLSTAAACFRLQLVLRSGDAWLLRYTQQIRGTKGHWAAEGRYD